jgi:hypothetical protein
LLAEVREKLKNVQKREVIKVLNEIDTASKKYKFDDASSECFKVIQKLLEDGSIENPWLWEHV